MHYYHGAYGSGMLNYRNDQADHPKIQVVGTGTVYVAPNQASIMLGVITEKTNLEEAQRENSASMNNIIQSLYALGLEERNIQTVVYQIDTQYDYQDGKQLFRGYRVNHQIQIKTENIDTVGQIVDTAVQNGANTVSDISFSVKNEELYYNEALRLALGNAETKAGTLMKQLHLTHPLSPSIIEEKIDVPQVRYGLLSASEATPIQKGEIEITATLLVKYR